MVLSISVILGLSISNATPIKGGTEMNVRFEEPKIVVQEKASKVELEVKDSNGNTDSDRTIVYVYPD